MKKYYRCKDIEKSLYIAPNEIRSCCQRFFHNGKMRGDAQLLKIENENTPSADDIKLARENLFNKIQNNESESCNGCPFLYETETKPTFNSQIDHLSIEHHSVCNLRCTYCSEIYYGGKRSKYNVIDFIKYLNAEKSFVNCKQVVWGGGEPTLDKSFEIIVNEIDKYANPDIYHRVFTNAVRYHDAITKFLEKGLIKIVTSIDAGTPETFKIVRGREKFLNVFENLSAYSKIDPEKITIKYILTNDNYDKKNLDEFVRNCKKYELIRCVFQISVNFKYDELKLNYLKSIIYLMNKFREANISKFFCDDHIAARFKKLDNNDRAEILEYIDHNNYQSVCLNFNDKIKNINIYGLGDIALNILEKTNIINSFDNINLFDGDPKKIGTRIKNLKIKNPNEVKNNDYKIYISTAQSFDDIYQNLINMNISKQRLISGLFI